MRSITIFFALALAGLATADADWECWTVLGVIVDEDGVPVGGCTVRLGDWAVDTTGADGEFLLTRALEHGSRGQTRRVHVVTVRPPQERVLLPYTSIVKLEPGKPRQITVRLERGRTVVGVVTDDDGSPLGGVEIFGAAGRRDLELGVTDERGQFEIVAPLVECLLLFEGLRHRRLHTLEAQERYVEVALAPTAWVALDLDPYALEVLQVLSERAGRGGHSLLVRDNDLRHHNAFSLIESERTTLPDGVTSFGRHVPIAGRSYRVLVSGPGLALELAPNWIAEPGPKIFSVSSGALIAALDAETAQGVLDSLARCAPAQAPRQAAHTEEVDRP